MSANLADVTDRVVTIKVSGRLTQPEFAASQRAAGEVIEKLGKGRLLIIVEEFQGTAKEGNWSDISFQAKYDPHIERIAIVCEPQWKETAMVFTGKGIRRMAIEHFHPADLVKARAWVSAD